MEAEPEVAAGEKKGAGKKVRGRKCFVPVSTT